MTGAGGKFIGEKGGGFHRRSHEKVLKLLTVPPEFVHTAIILTSSAERELLTVPDASEPADTTEPSAAVGTLNAGTERGQPLHEMVFS